MSYGTKKFPILLVFAFVLVVVAGLAYGYYYSQNSVVSQSFLQAERELAEVNNELSRLQSSTAVGAQKGLQVLDKIKALEIPWAKVINDIQEKIIPLDLLAKTRAVYFSSYSAVEGGKLNFNGRTNPSTDVKRQLQAIADTIAAFDINPEFRNAFVPSISKSVNQNNETILTFVFNVEYAPSVAAASPFAEASQNGVQRK
ncbi:hypothetical protein JW911_01780 [Candidatus Peregrinibacteria bacterium]|nr:hypothetical protein [Candidatus Peregrinibacteria bacterium]